ncbi:MAG: DUF2344 domain-containing protein, partial [Calditrichaeota bacterium]|nr:DUF2344 domain-containing protein [Calditrichota bacterium]
GLTFAVEAGSQRLRDVINKDLTEEQLFEAVERAWRHGWSVVKLYFMVGLPTERLSDIDEGAALLNRLQKTVPRRKSLKVSVSPFIPKPHSIFENEEFLDIAELRDRQTQLLSRLNFRTVKTSRHDARMSRIETLLARGNRRMARVIEAVAEQDSGIEAWSGNFSENRWLRAFDEFLPDWSQLLQPINTDRNTAWAHISKGFTKRFMQKDLATANRGVTLPDCKTNECYNCGLKRSCEQMASETIPENSISRTVPLTKEDSDDPEVRYRYRLTFTKLLHARYLGHHDLMRAVTRSLMRAGLSLLYTQGFNPRPKVTYDQAIPLGFGTSTFWVEFETGYELEVGEWLGRLVSVFPSGVKPRCLEKVVKGGGEQTLMSDTRVYRLRFDRPVSVSEASNELLADDEIGLLNWQLDKTARTLTLKMQRRKGRKLKPVNVGEKLINRLDGDVRILSVTNLKVDAPLE